MGMSLVYEWVIANLYRILIDFTICFGSSLDWRSNPCSASGIRIFRNYWGWSWNWIIIYAMEDFVSESTQFCIVIVQNLQFDCFDFQVWESSNTSCLDCLLPTEEFPLFASIMLEFSSLVWFGVAILRLWCECLFLLDEFDLSDGEKSAFPLLPFCILETSLLFVSVLGETTALEIIGRTWKHFSL